MDIQESTDPILPIDPVVLTRVVHAVLGNATAEVAAWQAQPAGTSWGAATAGVYRVSGTARDHGSQREWAVILKILRPGANAENPAVLDEAHSLYWKREALAYTSGLLDDLPGGITVPRCLASEERAGDWCWLWLEEARDGYGTAWPLEQYARAARCLGRFNGAYLAGRPMPAYPWLGAPGALRGMLDAFAWLQDVVRNPATWQHPLLRRTFPDDVVARRIRLWEDRAALVDALERLPVTLCHKDAFRRNMFASSDEHEPERLTLIDWAYVGRGEIGLDLADLFGASYSTFGVETVDLRDFDTAIFEGYLAGLAVAGWQGDPRIVRFGFAASVSLKYAGVLLWLPDLWDEQRTAVWEQLYGQPIDVVVQHHAELVSYLLDLADEAHRLRHLV